MNALIRLEKMVDKTLYYRGDVAVIKSFDNFNGETEIIAEIAGKPVKFIKTSEEKLDLFLANFSEVPEVTDDEATTAPQNTLAPIENDSYKLYAESKQVFSQLSATLLSDIEKVRTDPNYVNQAKQISNSVNTLVNLTKLQLQLIKNT
jgi:hypothetical protein